MLPIVEIIRIEEHETFGTFGVLRLNKAAFCVTLEPADRLNAPNVSSIPAQQYHCRRHVSPRYGETFQVSNVPGRTGILFHAGNVAPDTQGCILLASEYGKLRGARAVLNSGRTFRAFMAEMAGRDVFHLTVREEY